MTSKENFDEFNQRLGEVTGEKYLKEWFMPEDLEYYIRERSYNKLDWDEPTDWVNGMSLGLAFQYRDYFLDNNAEAKFRINVAMYLINLLQSIEEEEN